MSWREGHATHEPAAPEEHAGRPRRARLRLPRCLQPRPQGHVDLGGRRRPLEAGPPGPRRLPARPRRPGRSRRRARRRRPARRGRRGGPEPGPAGERPRGPAAGEPPPLLAPPRGRAPRPRRRGPAPAPGQCQRVLLPLAGRVLRPRRRHRGAAPEARRSDVPSLLRGVRPLLPPLLGLLHREAGPPGPGPLLDRLARRPLPARRLPPLLPDLPRAPPPRPEGVDRARALHAGARDRGGGGGEPRAPRLRRGAGGALGHRRGPRPRRAALLRLLLHPRHRRPPRLLPAHARPHRAPAGEVAAVGHHRRRLPLPRLLRPPLRPRPRARPRPAARGLRAARPRPALARLRGGQAPPDGRRAHLPPGARLRARGGGDRGARPPDRRPDRRPVGGAAHHLHGAAERPRGGDALHPGEDAHPGGARPPLLPGALQLAQGPGAALRGPERGPRPRAHERAPPRGRGGGARPPRDGPLPARRGRGLHALPRPRRAPHRRGAAPRRGGERPPRPAHPGPARGRGRRARRRRRRFLPRLALPLPGEGGGDRGAGRWGGRTASIPSTARRSTS